MLIPRESRNPQHPLPPYRWLHRWVALSKTACSSTTTSVDRCKRFETKTVRTRLLCLLKQNLPINVSRNQKRKRSRNRCIISPIIGVLNSHDALLLFCRELAINPRARRKQNIKTILHVNAIIFFFFSMYTQTQYTRVIGPLTMNPDDRRLWLHSQQRGRSSLHVRY